MLHDHNWFSTDRLSQHIPTVNECGQRKRTVGEHNTDLHMRLPTVKHVL